MDVPRSQLCPQTIALAGKVKKRMETVLGKMAILGNPFLLAVGRVLGGIQIDNKPLFVLPHLTGYPFGPGQGSLQGRSPASLPRMSFSNRESMD
jgi:hypothetical protein